MADKEHLREAGWQSMENDELERELSAALANYSSVEPRTGLEERILANLRAESATGLNRGWWRWSIATALTAVVIVALALAWRSEKPLRVVANHDVANRPSAAQRPKQPETQSVSIRPASKIRRPRLNAHRKPSHRSGASSWVAAQPKLDQFPSPQPLSEQEAILANYVTQFHETAVLLARLRTEELHRDQLEEIKAMSSNDRPMDSEPTDGTTER